MTPRIRAAAICAIVLACLTGVGAQSSSNSGWSCEELSSVDQTKGGAPLAQRDALKLLAVFLQHTHSKAAQAS